MWYTYVMDPWLLVEFIELLSAVGYLIIFAGDYEDDLTRLWFLLIIIVLGYDVFVLHLVRPGWWRLPMNIPTLIYCYEKLYRKSVRFLGRKLGVLLLMLFR